MCPHSVSTVCRGPSHVTLLDSQHFQREALAATVSPVEVQNFVNKAYLRNERANISSRISAMVGILGAPLDILGEVEKTIGQRTRCRDEGGRPPALWRAGPCPVGTDQSSVQRSINNCNLHVCDGRHAVCAVRGQRGDGLQSGWQPVATRTHLRGLGIGSLRYRVPLFGHVSGGRMFYDL